MASLPERAGTCTGLVVRIRRFDAARLGDLCSILGLTWHYYVIFLARESD
jgi:hypothetical protein